MNVDAIFDAVAEVSRREMIKHRYQEKAEQLRAIEIKECGHCYHWMKSTCVPEKQHNKFKSASSFPCRDYTHAPHPLAERFREELDAIAKEIEP